MGLSVSFGEKVRPLRAPGVNALIESLGIGDDMVIDRAAIKFVFREVAQSKSNAKGKSAEDSIDMDDVRYGVTFRYNLIKQYADDFFRNALFERNAVVLATICNEKLFEVEKASELYYSDIPGLKSKLNKTLLDAAQGALGEALQLRQYGKAKDEPFTQGGLFVAHENTLYDIHLMQQGSWDNYSHDEIRKYLMAANSFVQRDTRIGAVVHEHCEWLEEALMDISSWPPGTQPQPPGDKGPHLRLVT